MNETAGFAAQPREKRCRMVRRIDGGQGEKMIFRSRLLIDQTRGSRDVWSSGRRRSKTARQPQTNTSAALTSKGIWPSQPPEQQSDDKNAGACRRTKNQQRIPKRMAAQMSRQAMDQIFRSLDLSGETAWQQL